MSKLMGCGVIICQILKIIITFLCFSEKIVIFANHNNMKQI